MEDALPGLGAVVAAQAPGNGLPPDPVALRLDALPVELGLHLAEGGVRAAVLLGAAVDDKDLHV